MDWEHFRFIDLFAGIGGIRLGFEAVGGHCVFSSKYDEDACKTYEANFGEHPLYKPIQIAEVLYRNRVVQDIDLL